MKEQFIHIDFGWHKSHYKNKEMTVLHREDGPAREYFNGSKHWYFNGQRHREDGPAIEGADGTKHWFKNGQRHREDGPAVEDRGSKHWFINGNRLTEEEFNARKNSCNGKVVEIDGKKYKLTEI
jgi:hypothetical protein